jgi:hypothetical protein
VSQDGSPVVLRGGGLMELLQFRYAQQSLDYLKASGAKLVRIPLHWGRGGLPASYEAHWGDFRKVAEHTSFYEKSLQMIAALKFTIESMGCKWKLCQNRTAHEQLAAHSFIHS